MNQPTWVENPFHNLVTPAFELKYFLKKEMKKSYRFHSSMPGFEITPLHSLPALAASLGIKAVSVKDESKRFGLNAFKGLGASYAMASYFSKQLSIDLSSTDFQNLLTKVESLPQSTIATVTAGNHGKGVAWAARLFGQEAKIFMPKGTSESRLEAIQELGADASISELNYDDAVLEVAKMASENHWVLMQDTAWDGYEEIPLYIMQGYATIVAEVLEQLKQQSFDEISHVIIQAGVGSFAASIAATIYNARTDHPPKIIIVEPEKANTFYQSAQNKTGEAQRVHGNLETMMAGLACGEPNPIGWNVLRSLGNYFFSCDDVVSAKGMHLLGNPLGKDVKIISGESGAVPVGLLHELMMNDALSEAKNKLELDENSHVLVINTEGDTDPLNYNKIVNER